MLYVSTTITGLTAGIRRPSHCVTNKVVINEFEYFLFLSSYLYSFTAEYRRRRVVSRLVIRLCREGSRGKLRSPG